MELPRRSACLFALVLLAACETPAPKPDAADASGAAAQQAPAGSAPAGAAAGAQKPAAQAGAAAWKDQASAASGAGTYKVYYAPTPAPIPKGGTFALDVWVTSGADASTLVSDVALVVDARMPEHQHGMNRVPSCTRRADGSFRVEGLSFHMPGWWQLSFDVTRGAFTERAEVRVDLE